MDALHGIATPIFAVNAAGIVTLWNRKMQYATGISDEQISNHLFSNFLSDKTNWENALSRAVGRAIDFDTSFEDALDR